MQLKDYLFYQDDWAIIYCGDCLEIMPLMKPESVDLVVTDPPFFMPATHYQSRINWQRTWGDTSILKVFWERVMEMAIPRIKKTGHFLTFCNHESYPVFYPVMYERFDFLKSLIWDKKHVGLGRVWRNQHEMIIAARWDSAEFNENGKLRADILYFEATPSANREHPVEKPLDLLSDLIETTTFQNNSILDPFLGSGTTCVAAKNLNRKSIGIEINPKYCEIAVKRLRQEVFNFT